MSQDAQQVAARAAALLGERIAALRQPGWQPLPHQIRPPGDPYGWILLAGRMTGKTDACAHHIVEHVKGPPCLPGPIPHWIGIIAPTLGDAATACFSGPSGIRAHDPTARMVDRIGGTTIVWPNGSEAKLFGANSLDDVERLRAGGNRCASWAEELAAWRYLDAAWDQMRFGLRTGPHPHWVASTTPKPRPLIKKLNSEQMQGVAITRATYRENPYIPEDIKTALEETYGGTQLGRQELLGELIDEDENALWTHEMIDASRWKYEDLPPLKRITVGVDPSGGAGEQGIVVSGRAQLPRNDTDRRLLHHGFVLADRTVCLSPDQWARRAVQAAVDYEASDIVVERNYGGQLVVSTIRSAADDMGIPIPIRTVWATQGKRVRAEPVAALTEQRRWHHAGTFPELEGQMCTWTPELDWSPDRIDACLAGDTLITTGRGAVPIKDVTTDDLVMTRKGWRRVERSWMTLPDAEVLEVETSEGVVVATANHRFWVQDRGFVRADALLWNDRPLSRLPAPLRVVRVSALATRQPVYDLTVEGEHEFYANGILVHNSVWTAWHNKVVHLPPGLAGKGLGRAAPRQIG